MESFISMWNVDLLHRSFWIFAAGLYQQPHQNELCSSHCQKLVGKEAKYVGKHSNRPPHKVSLLILTFWARQYCVTEKSSGARWDQFSWIPTRADVRSNWHPTKLVSTWVVMSLVGTVANWSYPFCSKELGGFWTLKHFLECFLLDTTHI